MSKKYLLVEHVTSGQYYACDSVKQAERIGGVGMFVVHGKYTAEELEEYNPTWVNRSSSEH